MIKSPVSVAVCHDSEVSLMRSSPFGSSRRSPERTESSEDISPRQAAEDAWPRPGGGFARGPLHRARCECRHCGVHTITNVGYKAAGSCHNCGSFELVPITDT